jgi:L-asparaginase
MSIKILITGGTFDKEYNELSGELFFRDTHLREMLALGRSRVSVNVKTLMMIDSLFMTAAHRKKILRACLASKERSIVITHGTDTMPETARLLGPKIKNKTVVLTGAMVPYKFGSSDGMFNLGSAISFAQTLPPGVYIAMNGSCFSWYNVRKNKTKGEFEEITKGSK